MKILSLFDGISCARVALERAGIEVEVYYASEIEQKPIEISKKNYPDIIQLGDVKNVEKYYLSENQEEARIFTHIDLLIGGSPCQDLSSAKGRNRQGLAGARSSLFYEYIRILKEVKPKYFILENVASMSKEAQEEITKIIGVKPIMIDAGLLSAQTRKRLFWVGRLCNECCDEYHQIEITQPEDKGIVLRDIINLDAERKWQLPKNIKRTKNGIAWDTSGKGYHSQQDRAYSLDGKHPTVPTARTITKVKFMADNEASVGILNWDEIEVLQSLPKGYTDLGLENRIEKRGGVIGNAFNVDVIAYILSFIK